MARINIKQKAKLHNVHRLVVTDALTGKIKQEAKAYNIILDYAWASLLCNNSNNPYGLLGLGYCHLGTGTGTLIATRTSLFTYLTRKISAPYEWDADTDAQTGYHTRITSWSEAEIQNTSITEVGLGRDNTSQLGTHAIIEDSEGNPITVEKGTTDILTVYSTIFFEMADHGYGANVMMVNNQASTSSITWRYPNLLLACFVGNGRFAEGPSGSLFHAIRLYVGRSKSAVSLTQRPVETSIVYKGLRWADFTRDVATRQWKVGPIRFAVGEGNHADGIWEIGAVGNVGAPVDYTLGDFVGFMPIFRALMPVTGVWTGKDITAEEIGTGDDSETVFSFQWSPIVAESEIIKVDGVAQTRGTDYTIDNATGVITFDTAPGTGLAVTADYSVEFIPKDNNHVLDVSFAIQLADANA